MYKNSIVLPNWGGIRIQHYLSVECFRNFILMHSFLVYFRFFFNSPMFDCFFLSRTEYEIIVLFQSLFEDQVCVTDIFSRMWNWKHVFLFFFCLLVTVVLWEIASLFLWEVAFLRNLLYSKISVFYSRISVKTPAWVILSACRHVLITLHNFSSEY